MKLKTKDATLVRALDALMDGRTRDKWLTIIEIMEELTQAYNENPIRFSTRGLCASTYAKWHEYVHRNQSRGFTFRDVARVLNREGYARALEDPEKTRFPGIKVPVWGPR